MSEHKEAWSILRLLQWTAEHFKEKGVDSPRLSAELLLSSALACRKIDLYTRFEHTPTEPQLARFRDLIREAVRGVPIAYLVGTKEFYSLAFEVSASVLIPRPETEVLVEHAIRCCHELHQKHSCENGTVHVLDLGTGSGCIGITLAHELPYVHVLGTDISAEACAVAECNGRRLNVSDRFRTVQADGFSIPPENVPSDGFDLMVSNPPYVGSNAHESLDASVRKHEPHVALFADEDGLEFYRRIARDAPELLRTGTPIFVEIGYDQSEAVKRIMTHGEQFQFVNAWRDYNEGHIRVLRFDRM